MTCPSENNSLGLIWQCHEKAADAAFAKIATVAPAAPHKSPQANQRYDEGLSLQTSYPEDDDDDGGEDNGMEEDVSAALVTCGDTASVVKAAKGGQRRFRSGIACGKGADCRKLALVFLAVRDATLPRAIAQLVGIAGPVSEEMSGGRQVAQKHESATTVSHLARRDIEV